MKTLVELNKWLGLVDPKTPKPLKKLRVLDRQILLLFLQGEPPKQICEQLGCTINRVRRVISSDLGQAVVEDYFNFCDQEFATLYHLSIAAIRDALRSPSLETRLKAADKFLKAHGKYADRGSKEMTAEDVVRRILELRIVEERSTRGSTAQGATAESKPPIDNVVKLPSPK